MVSSYSLAYSPCPNDTFIFAAWTRGLLEGAPSVEVRLDDVEALNRAARAGTYALTKVSYGAVPLLREKYRILRAGGALGRNCGPLVVVRNDTKYAELAALPRTARIAIPGKMTTAFLLLQLALGYRPEIVEMRFDRIVDAVRNGEVDAGLIIHESRFTYQAAGLTALADLGVWWESTTHLPIPLGAILLRRDLDAHDARVVGETIVRSLRYAYEHPEAVAPYVKAHAFEMDEAVMQAHIGLYVNDFSFDVGDEGERAIAALFERAAAVGILDSTVPEFA